MNKFISVIEYCALRKHYDETIKINTKCGRKTKQLHMQDNKKKKIVLNILVGSKNMVKWQQENIRKLKYEWLVLSLIFQSYCGQ